MDRHRKVFIFTSAILLFQSQPGKITTVTAGAQSTTILYMLQAIQSEITNATCSRVSHLVKTICIQVTVGLCCLFTTAEHFIGLAVPVFQTAVFYKTFEI